MPVPSTEPQRQESVSVTAANLGRRFLHRSRSRVDTRLSELVPSEREEPELLHRAVRYSLLANGKRIRPLMTLVTTSALGGDDDVALDPACAIEMVHAASLILDDLPSMDGATLRRGKPANHAVFGEATATLASIFLLNRAYGVVAEASALSPATRHAVSATLSGAIGTHGAVAGQYLDLRNESTSDLDRLMSIEGLKTAALFVAAAEIGGILASVNACEMSPLRTCAWNHGLAFQLRDDRIDALGTTDEVGKDVRQDTGKTTLFSLLGSERADELRHELVAEGRAALEPLGSAGAAIAAFCQELVAPP